MNSLPARIVSAIIAAMAMVAIAWFFREDGIKITILLAMVLSSLELLKILFQSSDSKRKKTLFFFSVMLLNVLSGLYFFYSALAYVCISIMYFAIGLVLQRNSTDPATIFQFFVAGNLGFFYLGLLPAFAARLLSLSNGLIWFFILLLVAFAADTFAYAFGRLWGKRRILPNISPKKTVVGALGGVLGSILMSLAAHFVLPHVPILAFLIMGVVVGTISQFGDFFESLLKRVADVKDSGSFMPGHGGILDRIDGVLFSAPFVYLTASIYEHTVLSQ